METEIWKDVVGYEGSYQVSSLGKIRSLDRVDARGRHWNGQIIKPAMTRGYLYVSLHNGRPKTRKVHRLVCEAFIGPRPKGQQACHGPNGQLDNSVYNLRYDTPHNNQMDKYRDGTHCGLAVICSDGRKFISQSEAARATGLHRSSITACCKGKLKTIGGLTWRYENGPLQSKGGTRP